MRHHSVVSMKYMGIGFDNDRSVMEIVAKDGRISRYEGINSDVYWQALASENLSAFISSLDSRFARTYGQLES